MYFHAVKSTAHPPFIGVLGHSTDCIVKQSYTFAFVQACCVLLEEKLWAEAEAAFTSTLTLDSLMFIQHVFFSIILSVSVCTDEFMCLSKMSKRVTGGIGTV